MELKGRQTARQKGCLRKSKNKGKAIWRVSPRERTEIKGKLLIKEKKEGRKGRRDGEAYKK